MQTETLIHNRSSSPCALHCRGLVLVVDDEEVNRTLLRDLLETHGYEIIEAETGEQALQKVEQRPPDVILLDVMMPEMDGVEMIRVLRKVHPRLKIIASSGLGTERGGSLRAEELGSLNVKSFLAKPYTADKLLAALHGLLRNGNGICAA